MDYDDRLVRDVIVIPDDAGIVLEFRDPLSDHEALRVRMERATFDRFVEGLLVVRDQLG